MRQRQRQRQRVFGRRPAACSSCTSRLCSPSVPPLLLLLLRAEHRRRHHPMGAAAAGTARAFSCAPQVLPRARSGALPRPLGRMPARALLRALLLSTAMTGPQQRLRAVDVAAASRMMPPPPLPRRAQPR
jgi:hypothetical protein